MHAGIIDAFRSPVETDVRELLQQHHVRHTSGITDQPRKNIACYVLCVLSTPLLRLRLLPPVAIVAFLATVVGLSATPASASTEEDRGAARQIASSELSPEVLAAAAAELEASSLPRRSITSGEAFVTIYTLENGMELAITVPVTAPSDGFSPYFSAGSDAYGTYISLNQTDQAALLNGGAAALGAALCLLGPAVCIVAAAVLAWAFTYLTANGICSSGRELWIYFTDGPTGPNYSMVVCRPVSYPGGG